MAPADIPGLLNLRGQLLTALDLRSRLGLPADPELSSTSVVVSWMGELVALQVDSIGDVLDLRGPPEAVPESLSEELAGAIRDVHRVDQDIVHCLDVQAIMSRVAA